MQKEIIVAELFPHPKNRTFDTNGDVWENFKKSVEGGIINPPLVRPFGDGYQILCGHRRVQAAKDLGLVSVMCNVVEKNDREAAEILVVDNLEREELDDVEVAEMVHLLLEDAKLTEEEVADKLSRTIEWVKNNQLLLDLPFSVIQHMKKPKDDEEHLTKSTALLIANLPEENRDEALQMVLHPSFQEETLSTKKACELFREKFIEPMKRKVTWQKLHKKGIGKQARKQMEEMMNPSLDAADLVLRVVSFEDAMNEDFTKFLVSGDSFVSGIKNSVSETIEGKIRWLDLAVRNSVPVLILPGYGDDVEIFRIFVDAQLIRSAEAARDEATGDAWLETSAVTSPAKNERVAAAEAACEGEPEHEEMCDDHPKNQPTKLLDAKPLAESSSAWVDLTFIHQMRNQILEIAQEELDGKFDFTTFDGLELNHTFQELDRVVDIFLNIHGEEYPDFIGEFATFYHLWGFTKFMLSLKIQKK